MDISVRQRSFRKKRCALGDGPQRISFAKDDFSSNQLDTGDMLKKPRSLGRRTFVDNHKYLKQLTNRPRYFSESLTQVTY